MRPINKVISAKIIDPQLIYSNNAVDITKYRDMVEVIRCKACPYSELIEDTWYCFYWRKNTIENGYCHIGSE